MKKYLIIHHDADYDGILSNEVCRHFLLLQGDVTSIGWDYGKPVPTIDSTAYDQIYMVDISIKELMTLPRLIWIDHHKTAMDEFDNTGYCIDGVAACRLVWQWFSRTREDQELPSKEEYILRKVEEPLLIRLAGEHDIWDHRDERALILQSGLRELDEKEFADLVQAEFACTHPVLLEACLSIGIRAKRSRDRANAATIKKIGHDVTYHGLTFLCCNGLSGSQAFEAGIKPYHQALMGWRYDGQTKRCTVSLYHAPGYEDIDLSVIAKGNGGGGHKGACGFQLKMEEMDIDILNPL
jgi:hypothetical protein